MFNFIFGNALTRKVERKKKLEGEVEVLKKQQKVECETVCKNFDTKKEEIKNSSNATIASLKAQIITVENNKQTQCSLLDEQRKVTLDKTINDFDQKIISKQNQVKRLGHLIIAEQMNMEDIINPTQPNAPTTRPTMGFVIEEKPKTIKKSK